MEIEKISGIIPAQCDKIFLHLSDMRNFIRYLPENQISNIVADENHCTFSLSQIGKFGIKMVEKNPPHLVKFSGDEHVPFQFLLSFFIEPAENESSRVKLQLMAMLNPFLVSLAKAPLGNFADEIIKKIEKINYQ